MKAAKGSGPRRIPEKAEAKKAADATADAAKRAAEQHMLRFRLLRETPTDPADHDAKGHEPVDAYASLLPRGISMWTGETGFSGQSTITVHSPSFVHKAPLLVGTGATTDVIP